VQQEHKILEDDDPFKSRVLNSSHEAFILKNTSQGMRENLSEIDSKLGKLSLSGVEEQQQSEEEEETKNVSQILRLELNKEEYKKSKEESTCKNSS
jgi:hypothetical protein